MPFSKLEDYIDGPEDMAQMTDKVMFSSKSDEYETPPWLYNTLHDVFKFTLDPAASAENHKCNKFYVAEPGGGGLAGTWEDERVFCNPPYSKHGLVSQATDWCEKAVNEPHEIAVLLLPARTDTKLWQDYVFPNASHILFVRGRIKFMVDGEEMSTGAPFPSAVVVFPGTMYIADNSFLKLDTLGTIIIPGKHSTGSGVWERFIGAGRRSVIK